MIAMIVTGLDEIKFVNNFIVVCLIIVIVDVSIFGDMLKY